MSVYTRVERAELEAFLQQYPLGQLLNYAGIEDGIENTNYLLTTTQGDFVLTLFEWFSERQLGYFLDLLQHLHRAGFPCPQPQRDHQNGMLNQLADKPAVLFKRIAGASIYQPAISHCQQVADKLACLHRCGQNFPPRRTNSMDLPWCYQVADKIRPRLKSADYALIIAELEFQSSYSQIQLPQGLIHGDLFKDNVLFEHDSLSGVLDFYNACYDIFLIDVAITANDWCHEADGQINRDKLAGFLESYQQTRALTAIELELLPVMLRAAALRFWLSRLEHQLFPRAGEIIQAKNPLLYRYILEQHQATSKI